MRRMIGLDSASQCTMSSGGPGPGGGGGGGGEVKARGVLHHASELWAGRVMCVCKRRGG